jgi:hypothetical protein
MPLPFEFDFMKPDYQKVFDYRCEKLQRLRSDPELLFGAKEFYRSNPAQFIIDWGCTFDPALAQHGQPTIVPFLLHPSQEEWVHWVVDCYTKKQRCYTVKCRQTGYSWLLVALSVTLCLFNEGFNIGIGSKRSLDVDLSGNPKSLLYKARLFMEYLPKEFNQGWNIKNPLYTKYMMLQFPKTNSKITGDSGDNLGRGGTYFPYYAVDEAAFLERPDLVENSLSQATTCRMDISTVHGMSNPFAEGVHSGKFPVYRALWTGDPSKDMDWYQKKEYELDPITLAQEINCDFLASVVGILIPSEWVREAVDAHVKLGIDTSGSKRIAFDVADEGDMNAVAVIKSTVVEQMYEWSGKGSDVFASVQKAVHISDTENALEIIYDADGLGADVKGNCRVIMQDREHKTPITPFKGGSTVIDPERQMLEGRLNKDIFENLKAQAWWSLRRRFQLTYRAIKEGAEFEPGDIISLKSDMNNLNKLVVELSRPTYSLAKTGKILVDKKPAGAKSPNLADAVMMAFAPKHIRRSYFS